MKSVHLKIIQKNIRILFVLAFVAIISFGCGPEIKMRKVEKPKPDSSRKKEKLDKNLEEVVSKDAWKKLIRDCKMECKKSIYKTYKNQLEDQELACVEPKKWNDAWKQAKEIKRERGSNYEHDEPNVLETYNYITGKTKDLSELFENFRAHNDLYEENKETVYRDMAIIHGLNLLYSADVLLQNIKLAEKGKYECQKKKPNWFISLFLPEPEDDEKYGECTEKKPKCSFKPFKKLLKFVRKDLVKDTEDEIEAILMNMTDLPEQDYIHYKIAYTVLRGDHDLSEELCDQVKKQYGEMDPLSRPTTIPQAFVWCGYEKGDSSDAKWFFINAAKTTDDSKSARYASRRLREIDEDSDD